MTGDEFIKKHGMGSKEHWINYCEVVITQCGEIFEAVPSHSEWLYRYAQNSLNCTRNGLYDMIPVWASPLHWIAERFDLLVLWYGYGVGSERIINSKEIKSVLKKLKLEGLVRADIFNNLYISHEYTKCGEMSKKLAGD